ncbi:MAG: hypothetical protein HUK15_09280 [Bacteroidales bacterium]|nr:hypothetical protein [Bacteroidales bacterium]
MKKFLFIATIISSLIFVSCGKGKNHIYGKITDMSDGTSVAGVCVDLYLTKVTNTLTE